MGIDITTYRIRIGLYDVSVQARGYISIGITEIYSSSISVINIPIEMLRDDLAGKDNTRCIYVCRNCPVPVARVWPI